MKIRIEFGTLGALQYIAENLRQEDFAEITALSFSNDPAEYLAYKVMNHANEVYVARRSSDGMPISAWGYIEMWPGVGSCFAFGTEDWGQALRAMTNHVSKYMLPRLLENGFHRMECRALAHRKDVERWVSLFGAIPEAVLRSSGKRGEDFVIYRWLNDSRRRPPNASAARH